MENVHQYNFLNKHYQLIIQIMSQIFQLILLSTYELFQRWIETASIDVHSTSFLPLQSSLLSGMKGLAKKIIDRGNDKKGSSYYFLW